MTIATVTTHNNNQNGVNSVLSHISSFSTDISNKNSMKHLQDIVYHTTLKKKKKKVVDIIRKLASECRIPQIAGQFAINSDASRAKD